MGRKSINSRTNVEVKKAVLRRWTQSAVECYYLGCDCSKCVYPKVISTPCQMRNIVIQLVRKFGIPKEINYDNYDDETEF